MEKPIEITYTPPTFSTPQKEVRIEDIFGFFPQVTSAPTWTPRSFRDQFAIYRSGATYRFYIYDTTNEAWRFCALT